MKEIGGGEGGGMYNEKHWFVRIMKKMIFLKKLNEIKK